MILHVGVVGYLFACGGFDLVAVLIGCYVTIVHYDCFCVFVVL